MTKLYRLPWRKLLRPLKWVWLAFVGVIATTLVGRWLARGLLEGEGFALQSVDLGSWVFLVLLVLLLLVVLAVLTFLAWRDDHLDKARDSFGLLEPADQLHPGHLGFQLLKPGDHLLR